MKNLEGIQVGDRVWQRSMDRWGKVEVIDISSPYPIMVLFEQDQRKVFSLEGYRSVDIYEPDLFFDKIPEPEYPKRPIMLEGTPLKVGDVVYRKEDAESSLVSDIINDERIVLDEVIDFGVEFLNLYYTRTKPKRKVKKTVERWHVYYSNGDISIGSYPSLERFKMSNPVGSTPIKMTGEVEVEE